MTLTEMRYIIAVQEKRHFAKAAESCFVSQPTLSIAIKKLETELGVVIFDRKTLNPTAIGEKIIAESKIVMIHIASIKSIAKGTYEQNKTSDGSFTEKSKNDSLCYGQTVQYSAINFIQGIKMEKRNRWM